jgi:hypothetical protein
LTLRLALRHAPIAFEEAVVCTRPARHLPRPSIQGREEQCDNDRETRSAQDALREEH